MYSRISNLSKNHSFFLFGARATGKSTFLNDHFQQTAGVLSIDLLDPIIERELSNNPERLIEMINGYGPSLTWVFIDEVQKVPKILDVIHKIIFERKIHFALTGSSARKLKRGQANLLAGRAFNFKLYPMTFVELQNDFKLAEILTWGSLPKIFDFKNDLDKTRYLATYVQVYLKEEILVEQIVRKIEPFRAFLEVAAQCNSEPLNYSKIARESRIETSSVARYFEILADTWIGFFLEPYSKSVRKRQSESPKFYFFDIGVTKALTGRLGKISEEQGYDYGKSFEHLVILEIHRLNDYYEKMLRFSFLRTGAGVEVDLVVEKGRDVIALIEIKSSKNIISDDLKALRNLRTDFPRAKCYIFCLEKAARDVDEINIIPWQDGIKKVLSV